MSKKLRAKFFVNQVTEFQWGAQEVKLSAVYDDLNNEENNQFSQATPSGELVMTIDNPAAKGFFKPGLSYFMDFTEAPGQEDKK